MLTVKPAYVLPAQTGPALESTQLVGLDAFEWQLFHLAEGPEHPGPVFETDGQVPGSKRSLVGLLRFVRTAWLGPTAELLFLLGVSTQKCQHWCARRRRSQSDSSDRIPPRVNRECSPALRLYRSRSL